MFFSSGVSIDMQVLTDLKRCRFTVGRGPVPRRASIGTGNGLGRRAIFAQVERSRGTGPRATVCKAVSFYRRARACPSPCLDRGGKRRWLACVFRVGRTIAGDRPPRYGMQGRLRFTVGRGPVPRRASIGTGNGLCRRGFRAGRALAGDRPPRYGETETVSRLIRSGSGDPELQSPAPILLIVIILQILLHSGPRLWGTREKAEDRPPRRGVGFCMAKKIC